MKKITSLLLAIFISLCAVSFTVSAADGITFENTNEDLRLSISLEKTVFSWDEKINIDLLLENISEKSLFQHLNYGPDGYWWKINRTLIAEDGTSYGLRSYASGGATGATAIRELYPKTVVEDLSKSEEKVYMLPGVLPAGNYKLRAWVEYADHFEYNKDEIDVSYNTKSLETVAEFSVKDENGQIPSSSVLDEPTTEAEPTTSDSNNPTQEPITQQPTTQEPTQQDPTEQPTTTSGDYVHPTATAPNGFYGGQSVPNPPTDSGTIPGIAIALLGVSALLICTKKK